MVGRLDVRLNHQPQPIRANLDQFRALRSLAVGEVRPFTSARFARDHAFRANGKVDRR